MSRRKVNSVNDLTLDLNLRTVFEGYDGSPPDPGDTEHKMDFSESVDNTGYNSFYVPLI